jgi:nucleotide-binding universal stress UspA family protein
MGAENMETVRLLLPFTHGINVQAIEQAICLAQSRHATLVALVLLPLSAQHPERGVRLEHIEQANDFLKTVARKAGQYQVPLEQHKVVSTDTVKTLLEEAERLHCENIIVAVRKKRASLLHDQEVLPLLTQRHSKLLLIHLAPRPISPVQAILAALFPGRAEQSRKYEIIQVQPFSSKDIAASKSVEKVEL